MFRKYREDWCKRHGTLPSIDLREKYLPPRHGTLPSIDLREKYLPPRQNTLPDAIFRDAVQSSRRVPSGDAVIRGTVQAWSDAQAGRALGRQTGLAVKLAVPRAGPREISRGLSPGPDGNPAKPATPLPVDVPRDVMISYSHADKEMMARLRDNLEDSGITVWVDTVGLGPGVNFLSRIGQAIVDAKLFISMVSRNSIKSKFCQDELALAYVSSKPIFPVALEDRRALFPVMGTDFRLQLAGFKWTPFHEPNTFDDSFQQLLTLLQDEKNKILKKESGDGSIGEHVRPQSVHSKRRKFYQSTSTAIVPDAPEVNPKLEQAPQQFWSEEFRGDSTVSWSRFWSAVCEVFRTEMGELYGEDRLPWLAQIIKREMMVSSDDMLTEDIFLDFCVEDGEYCPFWVRMEEQAKESVAMEAVFNMESSVRVNAIENLAKFKSPAVVDALLDLLTDDRPDVRAVAAISLARINSDDETVARNLRVILKDSDRLVREAGCIAMGKLKIESATKDLLHIWRNDVIADVRASAELALKQIGGPDVDREMKVTKVLGEEIRMLTKRS